MRKVFEEMLYEPVTEINDKLGYIFDRKLAIKKDIYFCDGDKLRLYVTEGYEPKKTSIEDLFKNE